MYGDGRYYTRVAKTIRFTPEISVLIKELAMKYRTTDTEIMERAILLFQHYDQELDKKYGSTKRLGLIG